MVVVPWEHNPMPKPSFSVQVATTASPEAAYAYVSDLTRHGEWAANELVVEAVSAEPITIGSTFRSSADVGNLHFDADLTITQLNEPSIFAFSGKDKTGKFEHIFTFAPKTGGTLITRKLQFDLTPMQFMMYLLLYFPVRLPAARKAMDRLKTRLDSMS